MRENTRSEYLACSSRRERLVEIIVGFLFRSLSLMQVNSWEATKALVNSVPRSSMIRRSHPYRSEVNSLRSSRELLQKVLSASLSKSEDALK